MRERKPNRMRGYDYSTPGAYFVTICVKNMECVFGSVTDGVMILNECGHIANHCWNDVLNHYANIELDAYCIMPNHFHGIVGITVGNGIANRNGIFNETVGNGILNGNDMFNETVGNGLKPFPTTTPCLSEIIRAFKTFSSRRINEMGAGICFRWQKSFYDRIIRDDGELNRIRQYIINNPAKWNADRNNELMGDEYAGS